MVFNFIPFLIQLAIGVGLQALGYLLMPKPKSAKTEETTELENPTAEGGRPIPVVFGEYNVKDVNILFFSDKTTRKRKVS